MKLLKEQATQIYEAILTAYSSPADLRIMVYFELGESLDHIIEVGDLRSCVFNLIRWADNQGRLDDLIRGAQRQVPGNPKLQSLLASWVTAQLDSSRQTERKPEVELVKPQSDIAHIETRSATEHLVQGNDYYNRGLLDLAIAEYTKAIELEPETSVAYVNRSLAHRAQDNLDLALVDSTRAIEIDPQNVVAYVNRGIVYRAQGKLDLAIADYTIAIELDGKYAVAYVNRGLSYYDVGALRQAMADYSKAIALDPTNIVAYHYRGIAYHDFRAYSNAIDDFSRVVKLDPKHALAYEGRAHAYIAKWAKHKAVQDYQKAAALFLQQGNLNKYHVVIGILKNMGVK